MLLSILGSVAIQISGETGAIIALIVALGIAGAAIILVSGRRHN